MFKMHLLPGKTCSADCFQCRGAPAWLSDCLHCMCHFIVLNAVGDFAACAALMQVLHVEGQRNAKTLYVWDGSDARPFPYR